MWVCIVCIFLSWMPHLLNHPIGRFIYDACEPYLSWFRRFKFTRIASLDFSPVIALGVLSVLANICFSISMQGRLSIIGLVIIMLLAFRQLVSFFLNLILLLAFIRFLLDFSYKYRSSFFCLLIDTVFLRIRTFIMKYIFKFDVKKERFAHLLIFLFFLLIKLSLHFSIDYSLYMLQRLWIFPF